MMWFDARFIADATRRLSVCELWAFAVSVETPRGLRHALIDEITERIVKER